VLRAIVSLIEYRYSHCPQPAQPEAS
jgi:hypothetical protein